MLFLKRITDEHLLEEFRKKYSCVSGLEVPSDFLKTRFVYAAFNMKKKMCGGFVLGNKNPFRTIEVFAGNGSKPGLYEYIADKSYCELNCLWLSVNYRKGLSVYLFWLLFAGKVTARPEEMLMCGTISKSLADVYGYPRKSRLLHSDDILMSGKQRTSYIFVFARADFYVGVLETFIYKFRNNGSRPVTYKEISLPVATS
jgi:hypothetical protein